MKTNFIHLRNHTSYSLSNGAIKVGDLVDLAVKNNMPALAVTDSGNLFASLEFSLDCANKSVQPIIGNIVNVLLEKNAGKDVFVEVLLLAKNKNGYKNLLKVSSQLFLDSASSLKNSVSLEYLLEYSEDLICLTGSPAQGILSYYFYQKQYDKLNNLVVSLKRCFSDNLYIELQRHNLLEEDELEKDLINIAQKYEIPLVATNNVFFADKEMHEAHDALSCIAGGRYVAESDRPRLNDEFYFKSQEEMIELFADIPEAIKNTVTIAQRCSYMPTVQKPILPDFPTEEGRTQEEELKKNASDGLQERLKIFVFTKEHSEEEKTKINQEYFKRLDFELRIIINMGFSGYFLIVSDFIRWAKDQNIPVGPGRGSGAGSIVAWALKITDLDPIRYGLLFERFLNPDRISMPDFDIDFCQYRRDEVIKYVQQKYGEDKVAQIITFGKLQARAVLRDVGRVLQIPYGQVDKICKLVPWNPIDPVTLSKAVEMDPDLQEAVQSDEEVGKLVDIGLKLEGLHRHASTHAAGVVIGSDALVENIPLYKDQKSSLPVTQYSMKYSELSGLVKFDFLGLKTLTLISEACKLIQERGKKIDIETIPIDDEKTFEMLSLGKSTGVFQMESSGMRDAIRKMRPDSIEDIIALISLYRPGPMENIPRYIDCKHGKEKPDYLHPKLKPVLEETYGVMIYQEQVMEIAKILAGYTLAEADLLRRAMGKKIQSEMDKQRASFVDGAVKNSIKKDDAGYIFDLIAKFAGYGFNKSHAAAYALIGYQTAYLKANFFAEFICASINIEIGDTDKIYVFIESAKRNNLKILPPDINKSKAYFAIEKLNDEDCIRYGLGALKNLGVEAVKEIDKIRKDSGDFKNIHDFIYRCSSKTINKRMIESLAKSGAFDCLFIDEEKINRRIIFENATNIVKFSQAAEEEKSSNQINLFASNSGNEKKNNNVVQLNEFSEWNNDEKIFFEYDSIGFYLHNHPLHKYEEDLVDVGVVSADQLQKKILESSGGVVRICGVIAKVMHRFKGTKRFSYITISDPKGSVEISVFDQDLIHKSRDMIEDIKPLLINVEGRSDEGGVRLIAKDIIYLDDYLSNRQKLIKIYLKNTQGLENIADKINSLEKGTSKVKYFYTQDEIEFEFTDQNRYKVFSYNVKELNKMNLFEKLEIV